MPKTTYIYNQNRHTIETLFFSIVLLELFLMGSGRIIQFGSLTLRMILYLIAIGYSVLLLMRGRRIGMQIVFLGLLFLSVLSLSAFVGVFNNADSRLIFEDIKPLAFFLMGIFFWLTIGNVERVHLTIKLLKVSSVILAVLYLVILFLLHFNIIDFSVTYSVLNKTGEVSFRETYGFVYKGFLYLCVGFLFYLFDSRTRNKGITLLIFTATVLTFTRGFLLAIGLTIFIYLFVFSERNIKTFLHIVVLCVVVLLVAPQYIDVYTNLLGDKSTSDMVRIITGQQVCQSVTPLSIFIGHGFGIGVPERIVHMEVSYLEIFHKQGLVGVSFWVIILCVLIRGYSKATLNGNRNIALPFLLSSFFIYMQTLTNPFLNNPIGMSMILISIAVFNVLGKNKNFGYNGFRGAAISIC